MLLLSLAYFGLVRHLLMSILIVLDLDPMCINPRRRSKQNGDWKQLCRECRSSLMWKLSFGELFARYLC